MPRRAQAQVPSALQLLRNLLAALQVLQLEEPQALGLELPVRRALPLLVPLARALQGPEPVLQQVPEAALRAQEFFFRPLVELPVPPPA